MSGFLGLDSPAWSALHGAHRSFAESHGSAVRYRPDVSPFAALADHADPACWRDLGDLLDGAVAGLPGVPKESVPPGWRVVDDIPCAQMVDGDGRRGAVTGPIERLTAEDVPRMLELVAQTRPGPFLPGTIELGDYLGVRADDGSGRLAAMSGERMFDGTWREISAVCTAPDHRGRGLAGLLVAAVADAARQRGERSYLHVREGNPAQHLYERLGFTARRLINVLVVSEA